MENILSQWPPGKKWTIWTQHCVLNTLKTRQNRGAKICNTCRHLLKRSNGSLELWILPAMMSSICSKAASSIKLTSDVILTSDLILYFNKHCKTHRQIQASQKIPLHQPRITAAVDVNALFIFTMDVAYGFRASFHYVAFSQSFWPMKIQQGCGASETCLYVKYFLPNLLYGRNLQDPEVREYVKPLKWAHL